MRIFYLHQHFSTPDGSAGTRSYEMARRLQTRGHEVTMVCGSYKGAVTGLDVPFVKGVRRGCVDGIQVVEFDMAYSNADGFFKRAKSFVAFALQSTRLALSEDYKVIFTTSTPLTAGIPGIAARWLRGKKFVFEVRDLWPELPRAMGVVRNPLLLWLLSFLEWCSYHSASRLIGLSSGIVDGIARRGVKRERIEMIPNGCDMGVFDSPPVPWRPEGVLESDLLAVFAGTHGVANGLDALLDVGVELKRRGRSDIRLLLIGQGGKKSELKARAELLALENICFHEPVGKRQLAGLMASADIGLQVLSNVPAFYYGTSPNKFFDYISAGLPVLNNYPGWLAELILKNDCGYAVPPEDPFAFADALEDAANDRMALKSKGVRARNLAIQEFERGLLADRWISWVEGVALD